MRVVLVTTAVIMALLIGLQFMGDPRPARPFERFTVAVICPVDGNGEIRRVIADAWEAASDNLGCRVEPVYVPWDEGDFDQEYRQVASAFPSGICIMGYPLDQTLLEELAASFENEVVTTSFHARFPDAERRFGAEGFGFVGVDGYETAYRLAETAIKKHSLQPGQRGLIVGDLAHPARESYRNGYRAALEAGGILVEEHIVTTGELNTAPDTFATWLSGERERGTLPHLICFTEIPLRLAAQAMNNAGIEPGTAPLIGIGLDPYTDAVVLSAEHWGRHISLIASQDVALQAYLAILQVCMTKTLGTPGLYMNTDTQILGYDTDTVGVLNSDNLRFVQLGKGTPS